MEERLKVGRKAKVINKEDRNFGRVGTIILDDKTCCVPYAVHFGNGGFDYDYFDANELELIGEERKMNKSELKQGAILKTREGNLYILIGSKIVNLKTGCFLLLFGLNDDLIDKDSDTQFDIVAVYNPMCEHEGYQYYINNSNIPWTWERKEEVVKEITIKELEKQYGCKVHIVKDEDNK